MTSATVPGLDTAPTNHQGPAVLGGGGRRATQPDRVVFADGSEEEWRAPLPTNWSRRAPSRKLNEKKHQNSYLALSDPSDVARVESRTFICSEREIDAGPDQQLDGPGRDARHHDRAVPRLHARSHHVGGAVLHGPARCRRPHARRGDHRLRVRRRLDADHDPDGQGRAGKDRRRRLLRQGIALDRCSAGARAKRRAVAVQRHQVHHPLPGDPRNLELRVGLRRQCAAGQEVLFAADRFGDGPRRGLARRAHADPQADLTGEQGVLHRRGVPVGLRQDQPRDAAADHPGLARRDPRRRHRLDAVRQGRPAVRGQPRVRFLRRRAGHQLEVQPQRHADHRGGQHRLHQRRAHRRRRRVVGRPGRRARST